MKSMVGNSNIPSDVRGNILNRKDHRFKISQCRNLVLFLS